MKIVMMAVLQPISSLHPNS